MESDAVRVLELTLSFLFNSCCDYCRRRSELIKLWLAGIHKQNDPPPEEAEEKAGPD